MGAGAPQMSHTLAAPPPPLLLRASTCSRSCSRPTRPRTTGNSLRRAYWRRTSTCRSASPSHPLSFRAAGGQAAGRKAAGGRKAWPRSFTSPIRLRGGRRATSGRGAGGRARPASASRHTLWLISFPRAPMKLGTRPGSHPCTICSQMTEWWDDRGRDAWQRDCQVYVHKYIMY